MRDDATNRRGFRFSLRSLFAALLVVAVLTAWLVHGWRRSEARREYVSLAGAVGGHGRTMQGYSYTRKRTSIWWWLFGDGHVESIWLYPGSYDEAELDRVRALFPEAEITDYRQGED
jgi:hypothetical protein